MNEAEMRLKLHNHVRDILIDLAVDETLTEAEVADVEEGMEDLAEMLIDSLKPQFSAGEEDGEIEVTINLT